MSHNRLHYSDSSFRFFRIAPVVLRLCLAMGVALLAVAANCVSKETSANPNIKELTVGGTIHCEIAAGSREVFEISSTGSELFTFSLDKGDLALVLVLYAPAGQKLIAQTSHRYESLKISVLTDATGIYRLEVSSLEREASRNFDLEVKAVPATAADQKLNTARQSVARASFLRADWTEKSLREAMENYDRAAMIFLSLNNFKSAAVASMASGETCLVLGQYRAAIKRYEMAAETAQRTRALLEEAEAWSEIARLDSYIGKNDQAREDMVRALGLFADDNGGNQVGPRNQAYAQTLSTMGEINYSKGSLVKSSADFEHALRLFNEVGDRTGVARVHLFKGYIAGGIGEPRKAIGEISQALTLYRGVGDKAGEALCLTALGLSHSLQRDEEQAIKLHRQAQDIFVTIGDRQSEALTLNALGQTYEFLREYPMALQHYKQALQLLQDSEGFDIAAVSMFKVGRIYRLLGNLRQALAYYEHCLRLSRAAKKSRTEANALNDIALVYASQRNREGTIRQYHRILKFYASISDRRGQATALNNLGEFLLAIRDKKEALATFKRALPLSEEVGDKDLLTSTLYDVALANRDLGLLQDALFFIRRSIAIIEDLRMNVAVPDFRISYFSGARKNYDLYIDILMQLDRQQPGQGFATAGLLASENARARSLFDSLTEIHEDVPAKTSDELLTRERELRGLLRSQAQYQMELSIGGKNSPESEETALQVNQLRSEYQEVEAQLGERNTRFPSFTQSAPSSLEQIQAELRGDDTILLEFALGDERSYLWAVTESSLSSYQLPGRAALEAAGRELYQLLTVRQVVGEKTDNDYQSKVEASDRSYNDKAQEFSQLLLGQVAEQLGARRLVIVAEGTLQYVPWDALPAPHPDPADPIDADNRSPAERTLLIAKHEIVSLPSLSTLAAIRQDKHQAGATDKIVAILADPVFSNSDDRVKLGAANYAVRHPASDEGLSRTQPDPSVGFTWSSGPMRLFHAAEEVDAILTTTPRGTAMVATGFDANRETAISPLIGEYQIVHFATHGFFNSDHPELSGIVLSMVKPDGSKTDGFVPLQDVYRMNLSAQLVVVSACDTALGKDVKGEGLVGLTRGFMSAGSRSVVTSLWKVDDRATAELMKYFYQSMLQDGVPPAAALRLAKQRIRQQGPWSAPYFWAGFVFHGEYKEHVIVNNNSGLRISVTIAVMLLLISLGRAILKRRRRRSSLSISHQTD